jgi:hypothetical protein
VKSQTGAFNTALAQETVRPVYFVQLEFATGFTYFTNAGQDIVWNGQTWTNVAGVGQISDLRETLTGEAVGVQMELNSLPSSWLQRALSEHVQGKPATIWLALLDADFNVIADPSVEFRGLIDVMPIQDGGQFGKIVLTVENRTIDFSRPLVRRYNSEDQHKDYPNDNFFSHVEAMADVTIVWPHRDYFKQ